MSIEKFVNPMLCISTAHLTPETLVLLIDNKYQDLIVYKKTNSSTNECYGCFVYICAECDSSELPEDLRTIIDFTNEHEIDWVMLDGDEAECPMLPTYYEEWHKAEYGNNI